MLTERAVSHTSPVENPNYRWYILALATATHVFAVAIPFSCLPALFREISADLNLSLVQIGTVWGMLGLASVFTSMLGGWLGDRLGIRRALAIGCILAGGAGALRGAAGSFVILAAAMFLFGLVRSLVPANIHKSVSLWFHDKNLAMGNGIVSMGMGMGLMLGPLISATWLSPLLGGWRPVLLLYGGLSVLVGVLWAVFGREPQQLTERVPAPAAPVSRVLLGLARNKALWLLALGATFRMGGVVGMSGYLPIYLTGRGWSAASADGALSAFFAASAVFVIPMSMLSDRLGSRKAILLPGAVVSVAGLILLPIVNTAGIWALVIIMGMFMDAYMSVTITSVLESEGVGANSGMALGMMMTIGGLGGFLSPPIGNSLAGANPGLPFVFWAGLAVIALVIVFFIRDTGRRRWDITGFIPQNHQISSR